jgi:hypothetical protein
LSDATVLISDLARVLEFFGCVRQPKVLQIVNARNLPVRIDERLERSPLGVVDYEDAEKSSGCAVGLRWTAKLRLAMSAMGQVETHVGDLCRELGVTRQTLYRHIGLMGSSVGTAKNCLTELAVPLLPKPLFPKRERTPSVFRINIAVNSGSRQIVRSP